MSYIRARWGPAQMIIDRIAQIQFGRESIASGYLVTDDLVLTCAHVLGAPAADATCRVILLAQRSTELQAYHARVAWQSENIDVALIKLLDIPLNSAAFIHSSKVWNSQSKSPSGELLRKGLSRSFKCRRI